MKQISLIIIALILGIASTILIYQFTDPSQYITDGYGSVAPTGELCSSTPLTSFVNVVGNNGTYDLMAGKPFVSHTKYYISENDCNNFGPTKNQAHLAYAKTWQAYANLAVWAAAWYLLLLLFYKLIKKIRANIKH